MSGFLASRGLTYETADRLSKLNEQFCETLQFARMVQEQRLVQNSTTKKFDGNFVKFILSNRFGYRERSETQITGNPLAVLLEKIASKPQEIIEIPDSDITQGG